MRAKVLHCAALCFAAAALGAAILTEMGDPTLTRAQLLSTYWVRYVGVVLLLAAAIGAELLATEPQRR